MTGDFLDELVVRLIDEHPETGFQTLMYSIVAFINSFRAQGASIVEVLNTVIESLNNEIKSDSCANRRSSEPKNLVYDWDKARDIGESILAHQPTMQLKAAANFYAKIVVNWAFAYPKNYLSLQSRVQFSGKESDVEIRDRIVDYFIRWLYFPDWHD